MRRLWYALVCAAVLVAQEKPKEENLALRQKGRELLDSALKMVASAQPQVQVIALLHLADAYHLVDRAQALECLERGFAGAADLPSDSRQDFRGELQARIVRQMAAIDLDKSIEMLKQLPPPTGENIDRRIGALFGILPQLLEKSDFDRAMLLVESVGSAGEYPSGAAAMIFEKLPADDSRRITLFAAATSGFVRRPDRQFPQFLARQWQTVPRPMAEAAMQAVLNHILDRKDQFKETTSIATAKGALVFESRQERDLFEILHVLRTIDPKRAVELLETRPELRAAAERFPMGLDPRERTMSSFRMSGPKPDPQAAADDRLRAIAGSRAAEARAALKEDPQKALALAGAIPVPAIQLDVLGSIARTVSEKDPATAKSVLDRCMRILEEIKNPGERFYVWDIIADAAHRAGEIERAREAIERGLADAAEFYKLDTDAEKPNTASRDLWPSMQMYRLMMSRAATLFGVEAETLLVKITDPDLALLGRIAMASALLGRPIGRGSVAMPPKWTR